MAIKNKASFFEDDGTRSFGRKTWFRQLGWPDFTRFSNWAASSVFLLDDIATTETQGIAVLGTLADVQNRVDTKLTLLGTDCPVVAKVDQLPIVEAAAIPNQLAAPVIVVVKSANVAAEIYGISISDTGWVDVPDAQKFIGSPVVVTWGLLQERRIGKQVYVRGQFTATDNNAPAGLVLLSLTYPPDGSTLGEAARSVQLLNDTNSDLILMVAYPTTMSTIGNDTNGVAKSGGRLALALLPNLNHSQTRRFYLSYAID